MIICCGEALIDMLPRDVVGGGRGFLPVPGGASVNTATALGRLGQPVGILAGVSTDMFGELLIDTLHFSNVDTGLCVRSPSPTTLAFVKLTNGNAQYSFFDENSAARNLAFDRFAKIPDEVEALLFGGISLIDEPCGSTFETLMATYPDKVRCLDPNIRPGFIEDPQMHRVRIGRMAAMADVIKVSDEDLDWLATDETADRLVDQWLSGNTCVVLITRGRDGVNVMTDDGTFHCPVAPARVVDTIGAGDAFNAGFLAGLRQSGRLNKQGLKGIQACELQPALEYATKVAALTVSKPGADPPWIDEIDA